MSKVKVKGVFGGKTRFAQIERGELSIASIEEAFKKSFSLNSIQLKYNMSNGNVQGLYQDFHLENALKDTADSGAKYLECKSPAQAARALLLLPPPPPLL